MRTYVNDAMSYRQTDRFKTACAPPGSGRPVVDVTLRNTPPGSASKPTCSPRTAKGSGRKVAKRP